MVDKNKKLTRVELDIVRLRYLAGLSNQGVADFLGLRLYQVKYRIKKPNVRRFVQEFIWPHFRDTFICELTDKLDDPVQSYINQLEQDTEAMTYQREQEGSMKKYGIWFVSLQIKRR